MLLIVFFLETAALILLLDLLVIGVVFIDFVAHPVQYPEDKLLVDWRINLPVFQVIDEGLLLCWTLFYIIELIVKRTLIWLRSHEF